MTEESGSRESGASNRKGGHCALLVPNLEQDLYDLAEYLLVTQKWSVGCRTTGGVPGLPESLPNNYKLSRSAQTMVYSSPRHIHLSIAYHDAPGSNPERVVGGNFLLLR